jgi:two-component system phosphate regulon sensor histidine kinase PhoR
MKFVARFFPVILICAFAMLVAIQLYWFMGTYELEEKQFDERVNLSLRKVADVLLKLDGDSTTRIKPVQKISSNEYLVELSRYIQYKRLDSLVRNEFAGQQLSASYLVMIYNEKDSSLVLGNNFTSQANADASACLNREQVALPMNFAVVFPEKRAEILGGFKLWIFTGAIVLLILLLSSLFVFEIIKRKRLAELKNNFVSNMTHELQTPVTNIGMASEMLIRHPDSVQKEKYLHIIQEENLRLRKHIDEVLQLAKMEDGALQLKMQPVNVNDLIQEVIEKFQLRVQSRDGFIKARLSAHRAVLSGDAFHLANVLYNLLDNADKYSPHKPEIVVASSNVADQLCVSVTDKGMGIKKADQKNVFEKFYRASTGNVHDVKGFGLGLSYVKEIIEAHQGFINLKSDVNDGTTIDLYFPKLNV